MPWKEITVSAIVTLIVSIVAGVVVWILTREDTSQSERIIYYSAERTSFDISDGRIGLVTAFFKNVGNKAAHDIIIKYVLPESTEIKEAKITSNSGNLGNSASSVVQKNRMDISIPTLFPNETYELSVFCLGKGSFNQEISVKSSESVGIMSQKDFSSSKNTLSVPVVALLLAGALALQFILGIMAVRVWRNFLHRRARAVQDSNNTAFMLIQRKMIDDSIFILEKEIQRNGGNFYLIDNLALAYGLIGKNKESKDLFAISEWLAQERHQRAVNLYNKATLDIYEENYSFAVTKIKKSLELSQKEILSYLNLSSYVQEAFEKDQVFRDFYNSLGLKRQ